LAFTSIAALVSGTAATATLVLGAIAEVGLAMTVVGAAVGNEKLMKIGGVLGLVGGVGGLINSAVSGSASGASLASSGVETMESAAGMADAAYGGAAGMEASQLAGIESMTEGLQSVASNFQATDWAGMVDEASNAVTGAVNPATGIAEAATPATQTDALIGVNEPMSATKDVYGNLNPMQATEPARQSLAPTTQDIMGTTGNNPSAYTADGSKMAYSPDTGVYAPTTGAMDQKSWFSKIMGWAKENEKMATSMATLVSGGFSGMGQMKQAEMAQEANKMRFQYGNQVANFRGRQPLIGAV
jgi:hypothetical protein